MREIKFRAWIRDRKEMVKVLAIIFSEKPQFYTQRLVQPKTVIVCSSDEIDLLQFTGLKDKNGREIYEGDIVTSDDGIQVVTWDEYYWSLGHGHGIMEAGKLEVIGNKYEGDGQRWKGLPGEPITPV